MKQYLLNIIMRVTLKRIIDGEDLQTILDSYPNLSKEDKVKITNSVLSNL